MIGATKRVGKAKQRLMKGFVIMLKFTCNKMLAKLCTANTNWRGGSSDLTKTGVDLYSAI